MLQFYTGLCVLITGGCGFIGSHIAEKLVEYGAKVTIIDNFSTGTLDNIATILDKVHVIHADITNFEACMQAVKGQDIVFHTAAFISVPDSFNDPLACNTVNVQGTLNLLDASYRHNVKRFVFSSSAAVYGSYQQMCTEETPCHPESPYGFSKLTAESYLKQYAELFGVNTIILRYFNVYGPRQKHTGTYASAYARFSYAMRNGLPITIYGDGKQTRDFISVHQIVKANLALASLSPEKTRGHIFNIATGHSIPLLDVIEQLKKQFPEYNQEVQFASTRAGDIRHSKADVRKYRTIINELEQKNSTGNTIINIVSPAA